MITSKDVGAVIKLLPGTHDTILCYDRYNVLLQELRRVVRDISRYILVLEYVVNTKRVTGNSLAFLLGMPLDSKDQFIYNISEDEALALMKLVRKLEKRNEPGVTRLRDALLDLQFEQAMAVTKFLVDESRSEMTVEQEHAARYFRHNPEHLRYSFRDESGPVPVYYVPNSRSEIMNVLKRHAEYSSTSPILAIGPVPKQLMSSELPSTEISIEGYCRVLDAVAKLILLVPMTVMMERYKTIMDSRRR